MEPVTNGFRKMKNRKPTRGISLLSKTLRLFACCTAVCFVFTVPLFYLLTKYFYAAMPYGIQRIKAKCKCG